MSNKTRLASANGGGALRILQRSSSGDHLSGKPPSSTLHTRRMLAGKLTDENAVFGDGKLEPLTLKPMSMTSVTHRSMSCQTPSGVMHTVAVNTDVSLPSTTDDDATPTVEQTKAMLLSTMPTTEYWQALAEQRRTALEVALTENLQLAEECARLREHNRQLQFLADEGKQYAELLRECLDGGHE